MSLITLSVPGDVMAAIASVANAFATANQAIAALAADQSKEGREAVAAINTVFRPLIALLNKLEGHIKPADTSGS